MKAWLRALVVVACTVVLASSAAAQYGPSPYPSAPGPAGPAARVRFDADTPGVALHLRAGSATAMVYGVPTPITAEAYQLLCVGPCEANLPVGAHYLGLSTGGGAAIGVDYPINVRDGTQLRGIYTSNLGVRIAGWILMVVGGLTALGLLLATFSSDAAETDYTPAYVGLGVMAASQIAGQIMVRIRDSGDIEVVR